MSATTTPRTIAPPCAARASTMVLSRPSSITGCVKNPGTSSHWIWASDIDQPRPAMISTITAPLIHRQGWLNGTTTRSSRTSFTRVSLAIDGGLRDRALLDVPGGDDLLVGAVVD